MRNLAQALGVEAMSLYHHVRNKSDILDGMIDQVFGEIPLPEPGIPWRAAMEARAHAARSALRRHPWAVGLMESRSAPGLRTLRHHDANVTSLNGAPSCSIAALTRATMAAVRSVKRACNAGPASCRC